MGRALGSKLKLLKSSLIVWVREKMENPTMIQMETFASEIEDKILDFHVPSQWPYGCRNVFEYAFFGFFINPDTLSLESVLQILKVLIVFPLFLIFMKMAVHLYLVLITIVIYLVHKLTDKLVVKKDGGTKIEENVEIEKHEKEEKVDKDGGPNEGIDESQSNENKNSE